jgi:hypothetical protein
MSQEPEFVKVWDVSGGYMSPDDAETMGAVGLDTEGFLHVVASETEAADETLEQICERVNGMKAIRVRKAAQNGSVFTSEAYIFSREEEGFDEAVEYYLTNQEFLKLSPVSEGGP